MKYNNKLLLHQNLSGINNCIAFTNVTVRIKDENVGTTGGPIRRNNKTNVKDVPATTSKILAFCVRPFVRIITSERFSSRCFGQSLCLLKFTKFLPSVGIGHG